MEWLLPGSQPRQLFTKATLVLIGVGFLFLVMGVGLAWANYQQVGLCLPIPSGVGALVAAHGGSGVNGTAVFEAGKPTISVDIEGAVHEPGVYRLDFGAIVLDAIGAAGGLSDDANQELIKNQLNLARKLGAGEKLIIPSLSDQEFELTADEWCRQYGGKRQKSSSARGEGSDQSTSSDETGPVSINTASAQELEGLSGIGEKRAEAIIENRPYQSVDDLVLKGVISEKLLSELAQQLSL